MALKYYTVLLRKVKFSHEMYESKMFLTSHQRKPEINTWRLFTVTCEELKNFTFMLLLNLCQYVMVQQIHA